MRTLVIFSLLSLSQISNAQVYIKGVLNSPFANWETGDTLTLYGAYEDAGTHNLYYYINGTDTRVSALKISLLLDNVDFWDVQQFYYTSYKIIKYGWNLELRNKLEQKTLDLMAQLEAEHKLYNDKYLEDYLQLLIQRIHYPKIWKGRDQNISIKILNSDQKLCYAFDNGMILISTQLITNFQSEREIFKILTEAIGHILLNSNMENVNSNSTNVYGQLGAIYPGSTQKRMMLIANKFLNYYEKESGDSLADDFAYLNAAAGVISYTAWQEYYSNHYQVALDYIERLMEANIANSTDYMLKAKIFTKIANTSEANMQAINCLQKAASFKDQQLPEIYSDLGVLQLREKMYAEARDSFTEYYKLVSLVKDDEKMKWALKMVNLCDVYLQNNSPENPAVN